jgi:predicted phage tail protein/sulfur carrier protein ThiS
MNEITVVEIKNPFDHNDRTIRKIEYNPEKMLAAYVQEAAGENEKEVVVSVNGHVVERALWPETALVKGSYMSLCPAIRGGEGGGKNTLALIAGIALSVVSMGVGSMLSGGTFMGLNAVAMGSWSFAGYLAALAVMYVGGMIISKMTPKPQLDIATTSPTYSWNPSTPLTGQGHSLGIIYGTVRPTLTILAQHVTTDGEKQYLNILLCAGEGPIDSITNIKINDNPIENYGIIPDIRLGANNQTVIDNFNDTYADQPLSYELELAGAWIKHQTDGNAAEGLEIEFSFPSGLYHVNDDGALAAASVTLEAQYRKVIEGQGDEDNWINFFAGGKKINSMTQNGQPYNGAGAIYNVSATAAAIVETWTITCIEQANGGFPVITYGKKFSVTGSVSGAKANAVAGQRYSNGLIVFDINTYYTCGVGFSFQIEIAEYNSVMIGAASSSMVRRTYRVDHFTEPDQYEIRTRCTAKSGITARDTTRVYWSQLSAIMYDDFVRPGKVLIGIRALATGQLSGSIPNITCVATRSTVYVHNPVTNTYQAKPANNPAWASYDLIHRAKLIYNFETQMDDIIVFGAPKEKMIYQDFVDWADFCTLKGLQVNYFLDKADDLWTALREIENCGRGKVILKGTRYSAICDKPGTPVMMFTVGNIIKDTFKEEFLPMKDRANAIEITFNNAAKNYERDILTVYSDDWESSDRIKHPTQISLNGIISHEQAFKEARYRLRINKYWKRSVSFEADVDAISCQVGDVILVQHDVPQWGFGGRIMTVVNSTTLKLDATVTLEANETYSIYVRHGETDVIMEKTIAAAAQERVTDTITVTTAFSPLPLQHDVYSLGKLNLAAKPFRVINIGRAGDQTRRINALEYVEAVYDESGTAPVINYSALTPYADVSNMKLGQETYAQRDGSIISVMYVSWSVPRGRRMTEYHVFYSRDNGANWAKWGITEQSSITISGVKPLETYVVKICTVNEIGILSPGVISQPCYITGKNLPPDDVTSLTATQDPNNKTLITLAWPTVGNIDLKGYLIKESDVNISNYLTETKFTFTASATRTYNFKVFAVDTSNNLSVTPATASVNVTVEPSNVSGFTAVADPYDRTKVLLSWSALAEVDLAFYEVRRGDSWLESSIIQHTKATSFVYTLPVGGHHRFWIKAVTLAGYYSITAAGADGQYNFESAAPANATITQDQNDRTRLGVSWSLVADPDVSGYEVRLGYDWTTGALIGIVKEASITHVISASGTYNFMIRAKNVAGYYSAIVNVSGAFSVEVSNVNGFIGTRAANDKSKIRLTWNAVPERDVDHYEIREGDTWDTGTLIFGNVAGTFYDATTTVEKTYKYWIKAVSKAGKQSASPTLFQILISMNPTAPANFTVTTDPTDRTKAVLSWTKSPDLDVIEYEARNGIDWDSGTLLIKTKETRFTWTIPGSERYAIRLKARNASGFESDEVLVFFDSYIEPSNVIGFQALQNGENVLLLWNKIEDVDVTGFEVREGLGWETASLLATGITGTAFQFLADREATRTFLIKAVNRAGKVSQYAAIAEVTITNLPPRNVIVAYDEIEMRDGTKNGTVFAPSQFKFSTFGGKFSDHTTTKYSEVGGENVLILGALPAIFQNMPGSFDDYPTTTFQDDVPLTFQTLPGSFSDYPTTAFDARGPFISTGEYITTVKDIGKILNCNISALFTSSMARTSGTTASLFYRTSANNVTWTDWKPYLATQTIFRYVQFKAVLTTANATRTPEVNQFTIYVDVPDIIRNGSYNVAPGGSTIDYNADYYAIPSVVPTATTLGHRAMLDGTPGLTNFTVKVYNANNNDVGGPILWIARGY